ncbi:DedA family protein [Gephyromycinifex aptenodytis]|uniref:DedA family protein n=1 Tax=Gephyromycinifex aptenodytis TaxID=2716227 RepID=UPI001D033236|nr:VTT domain-containing protein [Gephyromycinifex aptenodytis]
MNTRDDSGGHSPDSPASGEPSPAKVRREGLLCGIALGVVSVYGVVMLPLRPWLLGQAPAVLAAISGSRTAMVAVGALAAAEGQPWLWPLLAATVSIIKFHWVFWWAGRLWGEAALLKVGGTAPKARRRTARAEALVRRYQVLAMALAYVPLPLPREIIHVALGIAGTRLRTFVLVDLAAAVTTQTLFLGVGALLGDSAVLVVRQYALYAGYISAAVLLAMLVAAFRARRRRSKPGS